ncbi:MAG TPA: glycosyltransferase family 2 protein [Solirubrobacteraceae bacterium]|jgi:dolichol-phosphate mannosyltransferase|nr:glycosyltransferase family 2 protein [Solirubrobacteraceae bacterium]
MVELSVVIPVYGCADCLRALHRRLHDTLGSLASSYEIVFVDDRSPDGAWETLRELAAADPAVKALRLSRNFGQHAAITAGLANSDGRFTAVMDCDLQDPPEELARLYAKAREGYDVVLTRRPRRRQPILRRLSGSAYFRVRRALVGGSLENNMPNLSLLTRQVVDAFLTMRDRDRQYLLIVEWLGFRQAIVDVEQDERYAGRSSYGVGTLLRVAIDGIFFQSTALLRWVVYAGFVIALLGLGLVAYAVIVLIAGRDLPQWTALPMLILLLTGFLTIAGGVTGLYVGKIFEQVKGRPLYVVDTRTDEGVARGVAHELGQASPDRAPAPRETAAGVRAPRAGG